MSRRCDLASKSDEPLIFKGDMIKKLDFKKVFALRKNLLFDV